MDVGIVGCDSKVSSSDLSADGGGGGGGSGGRDLSVDDGSGGRGRLGGGARGLPNVSQLVDNESCGRGGRGCVLGQRRGMIAKSSLQLRCQGRCRRENFEHSARGEADRHMKTFWYSVVAWVKSE